MLCLDTRRTLLGNTWSVPVVACLLNQLFQPLGFYPSVTPQEILNRCHPQAVESVQGKLFRLPLRLQKQQVEDQSDALAFKLGNLLSVKGEDILLTTPQDRLCKYQRLRATVPARLWRWKVIAGWRWRSKAEHINALELRAVLTTVRWRLEHQHWHRQRFVHLTDNMVCLRALSRGRSSSRKLRRVLSRINALLLASCCHPLWGYVHTEQNPADRPSRWGRRVKSKFRHA